MATDNSWASADDWEEYLNSPAMNQPNPDADNAFESAEEPQFPLHHYSVSQRYMVMFVPLETHYYMPDGTDLIGTEIARVGVN